MRALVTGANGFLGRHVVSTLLARGIDVRAVVRPAARLEALGWPSSVEVFRADLRASRELGRAFEGVDVLLHLAAVVSGAEDAQFAGTVVGTERLLDAMAASACRRLVLCSTFSVYDFSSTRRILDENSPLHAAQDVYARDGYTIAKWWQERVTRRFAETHGWDLTVLRPGFIWGRDHAYMAALGQQFGGHQSGDRPHDPRAANSRRELRRRLCADGGGCPRPRADLQRGRRPRRTHLDLSLRLYARQRPVRLARARSLLARHKYGAAGFRYRLQARHQGAEHPHPRPVGVAAEAPSLRQSQAAGNPGMDPAARLPAVPGADLRPTTPTPAEGPSAGSLASRTAV